MVNLDELIINAQELSPLPASVVRLASLAASSDTDLDAIADVIAYDQALTLRLLRAANSAASAGGTVVLQAREAMFRLGLARVLALAMASSVQSALQRDLAAYGLGEGQLWKHSVNAAVVAETLPEFCQEEIPAETFSAALLHDVGKLVMARFLGPDILEYIRRAQVDGGMDALTAENQVLLVHHGELGGIVAQHWSLPERIVKGIIYHHQPGPGLDIICDAVYLSNVIAHVLPAGREVPRVDSESIERLGLSHDDIPHLITAARGRADAVSARYNGTQS